MSKEEQVANIFLTIPFYPPKTMGSIKQVEIIGVPGEQLSNGEYSIDSRIEDFFDDLIAREIFYQSSKNIFCQFKQLKFWLYDTKRTKREHEYKIPDLDNRDLKIESNTKDSSLDYIYVLDNRLIGNEYDRWKKNAEDILTPLFRTFKPQAEIPDNLSDNPIIKILSVLADTVDNKNKGKKSLYFNALIVQID